MLVTLFLLTPSAQAACEYQGSPPAFVFCIDELAQDAWDTAMANAAALGLIWSDLDTQRLDLDDTRVDVAALQADIDRLEAENAALSAALGGVAGPGRTPATAEQSCLAILGLDPQAPSGRYWVAPEQVPIEVYCDMSTDGGGWTLVSQGRPVADPSYSLCNTDAVGSLELDDETTTLPAKLADSTINGLWAGSPHHHVMHKQEFDNLDAVEHQWTEVAYIDMVDDHLWSSTSSADLSQLESRGVVNLRGVFSGDLDATWSVGVHSCGHAFYNQGAAQYMIYTAGPSYNGGACAPTTAGRAWTTGGNGGCSSTKFFVR